MAKAFLWFGYIACLLLATGGAFLALLVLARGPQNSSDVFALWLVVSLIALIPCGAAAWSYWLALKGKPKPLMVVSAILCLMLVRVAAFGDPKSRMGIYALLPLTFFGISFWLALRQTRAAS